MAAMWSSIVGLLLVFLLPLTASSPNGFIRMTVQGNVFPVGHYYVTMGIGNPAKPYFLDVDTGSNLTWVQCKHPVHGCTGCNPGTQHPYYTPKPNNLVVKCHDPLCNVLRQDLPGTNPTCDKAEPHECHYKVQYVDGKTEGILANDTFPVDGPTRKRIVFGCGYKQESSGPAHPSPVDGILGLGMGQVGFVVQLKKQGVISKNIIGHCLSSINGKSRLYIGEFKTPPVATWVPMAKSQLFYSPGKATLLFHDQPINSNRVQVVFDSGATYTYVPGEIYNGLLSKVKASLSGSPLKKVNDNTLPECWGNGRKLIKSVNDVKAYFKVLSLKFPLHDNKEPQLHIPPENYLIVSALGNVCLGILDGNVQHQNHHIIIGDISMQNLFVIYDNETRKLGWHHLPCNVMN